MSWEDMVIEIMNWINSGETENLSDWEKDFILDIDEKYNSIDEFEPSPRQGEKIEEIYYKGE